VQVLVEDHGQNDHEGREHDAEDGDLLLLHAFLDQPQPHDGLRGEADAHRQVDEDERAHLPLAHEPPDELVGAAHRVLVAPLLAALPRVRLALEAQDEQRARHQHGAVHVQVH